MLSAYDLSGDPLMLERAIELGDWLLPSLGTKYGLAINRYTLGSNPAGLDTGRAVLSEVGSLTMEFTRLSMLTGNEIYYQAVSGSTSLQRGKLTLFLCYYSGPTLHGYPRPVVPRCRCSPGRWSQPRSTG